MKPILPLLLIIFLTFSCQSNKNEQDEQKTTLQIDTALIESNSSPNEFLSDSVTIWISEDFQSQIQADVSICDCWRNTEYHFLYFDTINLELYLKSNLMHYGHDSDLMFPLIKKNNTFKYDSTLNGLPLQTKELEILTGDTLILTNGNQPLKFTKEVIQYQKDTTKKHFSIYGELRDIYYSLNSRLLIKYNQIDSIKSTDNLFNLKELTELIKTNKVHAYCSDDYNLDGITFKEENNRYFELVFKSNEVYFYEHQGRDKGVKLNLDSLPRQVLRIK